MGNQVQPRRGSDRSRRPSRRGKDQPRRRKVEMVAFRQETHCGTRRRDRTPRRGLQGLFRIGFVALLLLVPLFIAASTTGSDPSPGSPFWDANAPQALKDPLRSGSNGFALLGDPLDLQWESDGHAPFLAAPVMDDGRAYAIDRKGVVTALNLTTGEVHWTTDLKQEVRATPALAYGWLYVGTEAKELHALSAQSGTVLHKVKLDGAVRAPPLVAEGRVYVGTEAGVLQVFDATTLDEVWRFATSTKSFKNGTVHEKDAALLKPIRSAPAAYDGRVYFAAWNARAYALTTHGNVHGGPADLLWTRTVGDLVNAPVTVDHHRDQLIVSTGDGQLEAIHRNTGSLRWRINAGDAFTGGVAVNETLLVAATTDGRLFAVDPLKGKILWERDEPGGLIAAPILTKDAVISLNANGTLSLRAPGNGSILQRIDGTPLQWRLDESTHATPAVTQRGIVTADQGGTVRLIGPTPQLYADLGAHLEVIGNRTSERPLTVQMQITNDGPHPAPGIDATLYLAERAIETTTFDQTPAGTTRHWNVSVSLAPGDHTLRLVAAPLRARDPAPAAAEASVTLQIIAPTSTTKGDDLPLDADGNIDMDQLYGTDPEEADASRGFTDGIRAAWTGWMIPIGAVASAGGVFMARSLRGRKASA